MPLNKRESIIGFAILLLLGLTWGSSYILIKKGLIAFSPLQVAMLRFGLSGLAFVPLAIRYIPLIKKVDIWRLVLIGLLGSGIPAVLFAFAQTRIASSMAGILSSFTPLATYLLGLLFFGVLVQSRKMLGVLIGLIGAITMIWFDSNGDFQGDFWYGGLVILATICYAMNSNLIKHYFQNYSPFYIAAVSFTITGLPVFGFIFFTDFTEVLQNHPHGWTSLGYLALLAIFGTVIASVLFFKLVQMTDALFASSISYLVPVFAILWGLLDGEVLRWYHLIGMVSILAGIYFSRPKNKQKSKPIPDTRRNT